MALGQRESRGENDAREPEMQPAIRLVDVHETERLIEMVGVVLYRDRVRELSAVGIRCGEDRAEAGLRQRELDVCDSCK